MRTAELIMRLRNVRGLSGGTFKAVLDLFLEYDSKTAEKRAKDAKRKRIIRGHSVDSPVGQSADSEKSASLLREDINIRKKGRARGTRLSADWLPSPATCEAMRIDCGVEGDGMTATLKRFRDYWIAIPGQKGCKLDWDATLRNWIRKDCEKNTPAAVSSEERYKRAVEAYRSGGPLNGASR